MPSAQDLRDIERHEVERMFAGALFIALNGNDEYVYQKIGWLTPEMISDHQVRRFWANLLGAYRGKAQGAALEVGDDFYADCLTRSLSILDFTEVDSFAQEINRRAYLSQVTDGLNQLMSAYRSKDVEKLRSIVAELYTQSPSVKYKMYDMAEAQAMLVAVANRPESTTLSTLVGPIDRAGKPERGKLWILAARPRMGKTTLAFQIARNVAMQGHKVLYFSLEMGLISLWAKAACGAVGVQWRDVRDKNVSTEEIKRVFDNGKSLSDLLAGNLKVDDSTYHTVGSVWRIVSTERPALVIIDVLQLLKDTDANGNEIQRLGKMVYGLHDMAKENNCSVIALHHVNRRVETAANHKPLLADLRDSGFIEQAADVVAFLHGDDFYGETNKLPPSIPMDVIYGKNRDGVNGATAELRFDTKKQYFLGKDEKDPDEQERYVYGRD